MLRNTAAVGVDSLVVIEIVLLLFDVVLRRTPAFVFVDELSFVGANRDGDLLELRLLLDVFTTSVLPFFVLLADCRSLINFFS
jgi:hypothetical protein